MDGVFTLKNGEVIGRIPNTGQGSLVGMPRKGEIVNLDNRQPHVVIGVLWIFNEFENRVEIVLEPS